MGLTAYGRFVLDLKKPFFTLQGDILVQLISEIINELQKDEIMIRSSCIVRVIKIALIQTIREGNYLPIKNLHAMAIKSNVMEAIDKDLFFTIRCLEDNLIISDISLKKIVDGTVK